MVADDGCSHDGSVESVGDSGGGNKSEDEQAWESGDESDVIDAYETIEDFVAEVRRWRWSLLLWLWRRKGGGGVYLESYTR